MTLLVPLGLLGLLSLIVLFIIYIIRPNFQQRIISSTYIWKLSLKYKKKRIPVSKLRNFLLILCQVLIFCCLATILAQPNKVLLAKESGEEIIIVIDASASMRIESDGETRFQRAIANAIDEASVSFEKKGKVSVIIADDEPYFLASRVTVQDSNKLYKQLRELSEDIYACTYGKGDIDAALSLCSDIIAVNEDTQIFLYTDVEYDYAPTGISLRTDVVVGENEWNLAILNAYTEFEENYYNFYVDVASYGRNFENMQIKLSVSGANDSPDLYEVVATIPSSGDYMRDGETYTLVFRHSAVQDGVTLPDNYFVKDLGETGRIFQFDTVYVSIVDKDNSGKYVTYFDDSFSQDNEFYIYGGQKNSLKIQYASSFPNPFVNGALLVLQSHFAEDWDVTIESYTFIEDAKTEGFDFYVFEHDAIPEQGLPVDGVSLVIAPLRQIGASGVRTAKPIDISVAGGVTLTRLSEHPLLKGINEERIFVTQYYPVSYYDDYTYTCLWDINGSPALLVANDVQNKAVFLNFDLHYSNFPLTIDFPLFMYNLFEYYFPPMIDNNSFEVNEKVSFSARGDSMLVTGPSDYSKSLLDFPASLSFDFPGTYTVSQTTLRDEITESFYVRIPSSESVAYPTSDTMLNPYEEGEERNFYQDLLLYVAIGLTAIMFAEWFLQLRDNM